MTTNFKNTMNDNVNNVANYPIFDIEFKTVDWALNVKNIEKYRDEVNDDGAILVRGTTEDGDFSAWVIADVDIADGLYDAMSLLKEIRNDFDTVEVFYTTKCDIYGVENPYAHGQDMGFVISAFVGVDNYEYQYSLNKEALCRIKWPDLVSTWKTNDWGMFDDMISEEFINSLIESRG